VGFQAGLNQTIGSNNIYIGNTGVAGEQNTIRIGAAQTLTYIAGISTNTTLTGGVPVMVDMNGQLGVGGTSSERFKSAILPMGSTSTKLTQLRPVTFRYKTNPQGALRYGLIAEEVAKVYPDLVIRSGSGRIDGVRYDELAPLLLNEMQRQQRKNDAQAARIAAQDAHLVAQAAQMCDLKQQQLRMQQQMVELKTLNQATQTALRTLKAKAELVAQR
jgi:hypothetical protein